MEIPVSYILGASDEALRNVELARLNHVAALTKELRSLRERLWREQVEADVVRWLLENREELLRMVGTHLQDAAPRALPVRTT